MTFMQLLILIMEFHLNIEDMSESLLIFSSQLLEQIVSEVVDKLSGKCKVKIKVIVVVS